MYSRKFVSKQFLEDLAIHGVLDMFPKNTGYSVGDS